ncbi:putative nucleoporin [Podospora fimiseda]|uniref:Nucleoporin n=1 Tax=Podospora fimiseda TaxID=252190 RepID=A0AAN7H397_9PEZI|nr:putative nucleoporin [Podospora fimiseda]
MAFGFSTNVSAPAGGVGGLTQGSDLEVIQTEGLGFLSIAGDAKVQLTSKWSPPPAPTASLISIASRKGLIAAAGPDAIHIATTESVRKAFEGDRIGDSEVRSFTPQAKVPLPIRISQLVFTADEQHLILSAEDGGGLAVYDVQSLLQGSTQSAFEIPTNGESLRALAPNPMPEMASLCAIVTNNGNLLMANLAERKLISGPNGPALRSQVSCVSWSTKGKQLVAGMADGSIYQMKPEGVETAHIPKPPSLGDYHVASLAWIENNVFLAVYNKTGGQDPSVFNVITRQQPANGGTPTFTYQKLTDPVEPFVMEKAPHHVFLRLKDFPPNLTDLLLVASTANESIGILSRSKTPLAQDKAADLITNVFTTTELADDSKRAQMPMSEDLTETYPIGAALDLSSKDKVYKPIPTDEMDMSPGPLPGLWVLNNEGVLASWWVVYNESIRSGTIYPGIVTGDSPDPTFQAAAPAIAAPTTSAFGAPASSAPAFGSTSTPVSAFGGSSALGAKTSPWATGNTASATPAFGSNAFGSKPAATAPAFGTSTFGSKPAAPAFGQSSLPGMGLGAKTSPWASGSTSTAGTAFGQSGFAAAAPAAGKVFGSGAGTSSSSGFASFASKSGFGAMGGSSTGSSIFGSKPAAPLTSSAPEASMKTDTAFPKTEKPSFGTSPFTLGTTFKADPLSAADNEKPKDNTGTSMFGSGFGLSLDDTSKQTAIPESKDEDMDTGTPVPEEKPRSLFSNLNESTTPTSTPAPSKFLPTAGPSSGSNLFAPKLPSAGGFSNIFGTPKPATTGVSDTKPVTSVFGAPKPATANPFGAPKPVSNIFGAPKIKQEDDNKENISKISEVPLPPDSTKLKVPEATPLPASNPSSKDTSKSPTPKEPEAAPLPPDFLGTKTKAATKPSAASDAPLPPDFLKPTTKPAPAVPSVPESPGESDLSEEDVEEEYQEDEGDEGEEDDEEGEEEDEEEERSEVGSEGSGIDVTKEFGGQTPGATPQGSFDAMTGSAFSTISRSEAVQGRPLFGEIGRNVPPLFPKPVPHSPRSPSPMRGPQRSSILRAAQDTPRGFSAPTAASQLLGRTPAHIPDSPSFAATQRQRDVDPNVKAQRKARQKEAEGHPLVDPEDEGIQQLLRAPIEPSLKLNEFIAVDVQPRPEVKSGEEIPSACESVWRDVNRMIDNLGLNSRSLQSYILGHTIKKKAGGREGSDLDTDDWVLVESQELGNVMQNELARDLEEGRIKNVANIEEAIQNINKDLTKLRARREDMNKIILSRVDPDQISVAKSLPLNAEQAAQQNELRRSFATFSKLLAEAEEALTLLKAKIASAGGASGKAPVPTFEAIIRTINKMTTMAEKRSGDIDVLENQMRRLRLGSLGPSVGGTPGPRSREGSPFVTPQRKSIMTPDRTRDSPFASSIASYGGLRGTPTPRKKLTNFTEEEKKAIRQKETTRKNKLNMLKSALERNGPNVSRLRDDD